MSKEKQNKDLLNTLITVAESSSITSTAPVSKKKRKTVAVMLYEVLCENPYHFEQYELFYEVHITRMGKESENLKLETYKLQRSELCSTYGWGIHCNENGKIGLVAVESERYHELLINSKVNKKKAYNKK